MGDPPKTFGIGFGLWTGRYKLLGLVTDVTDVRYGYCCLALQRFTFWKHDPPRAHATTEGIDTQAEAQQNAEESQDRNTRETEYCVP